MDHLTFEFVERSFHLRE